MVLLWCGLDAVLLRALSPLFSRKKNILSFLLQKQQSLVVSIPVEDDSNSVQNQSQPFPVCLLGPSEEDLSQKFAQKQQKVFFPAMMKKCVFFKKKFEAELKTLKRF